MTDTFTEGGTLYADKDTRTVRGLLLPWNEQSRSSNIGPVTFPRGVVRLPRDASVVTANIAHNREEPVGRATLLEDTDAGLVATFSIADTDEGDTLLADIAEGRLSRLSAEVKGIARDIKDGVTATSGALFGAAFVTEGAFKSAALYAELVEEPAEDAPVPAVLTVDEEGDLSVISDKTPETVTVTTSDSEVPTIYTPTPQEKEETEMGDSTPENGAFAAVTNGGTPVKTNDRPLELGAYFSAFSRVMHGATQAGDETMLAALSDIKISGTGALPGAGVIQQNWLGELYAGVPYVREFITLHNLGTNITAGGKKGFNIGRGTAASPITNFDGSWAGNKTDIKSGVGFTSTRESTLERFAFGNDIAREFFDLPGGEAVVEAFLKLILEDHLVWSDNSAANTIKTVAAANTVAPATYPSGYTPAMGMVLQGILAVKARKADGRRDVPTYAILNQKAYEAILYTPKDQIPEFITFGVDTDRQGSADKVALIQGDTGINATASVIVGAKNAIEFDEISGGPVKVDALDLAKGGVDRAVHGYLQTFVVRPQAIVRVGTGA